VIQSQITPVFSVTWSFRICCSRNNSNYYQCWKQHNSDFEEIVTPYFQDSLMNRKFKRTAFNELFTVTFDPFKASLLNKSIHFFQKTANYCTVDYFRAQWFHVKPPSLFLLSRSSPSCFFPPSLISNPVTSLDLLLLSKLIRLRHGFHEWKANLGF